MQVLRQKNDSNSYSSTFEECVEMGILCDLAPPTISECNTTVLNTNPK